MIHESKQLLRANPARRRVLRMWKRHSRKGLRIIRYKRDSSGAIIDHYWDELRTMAAPPRSW